MFFLKSTQFHEAVAFCAGHPHYPASDASGLVSYLLDLLCISRASIPPLLTWSPAALATTHWTA